MSESNKWFRDKWNRLDKLKHIEDNWVGVFNERIEKQSWEEFDNIMVDEIRNRFIKIEKLIN